MSGKRHVCELLSQADEREKGTEEKRFRGYYSLIKSEQVCDKVFGFTIIV